MSVTVRKSIGVISGFIVVMLAAAPVLPYVGLDRTFWPLTLIFDYVFLLVSPIISSVARLLPSYNVCPQGLCTNLVPWLLMYSLWYGIVLLASLVLIRFCLKTAISSIDGS